MSRPTIKEVKARIASSKAFRDAEQIVIWKSALALMDGRTAYARFVKRAVQMIEERDPHIAVDQATLRALYDRK